MRLKKQKIKTTKTIAMMITKTKLYKIFCMTDDFCEIQTDYVTFCD